MNFCKTLWILCSKDLRLEFATHQTLLGAGLFAVLLSIEASLAFYLDPLRALELAPGALWLTVTFSGFFVMARAWALERNGEALAGLWISPAPRSVIYVSKVLSAWTYQAVLSAGLLALIGVLFHVDWGATLMGQFFLLLVGNLGFAASGNLVWAISTRTSRGEWTTSLALFPLTAPALLAGVVASRTLAAGATFSEVQDWLLVLLAYAGLSLAAGLIFFEKLLEE